MTVLGIAVNGGLGVSQSARDLSRRLIPQPASNHLGFVRHTAPKVVHSAPRGDDFTFLLFIATGVMAE